MKTAQFWLDAYGESHRDVTNKILHWVCVPLIVLSVVGLLWSLPVPAAFTSISPALTWGTAFMLAAVVYYFIMSLSLGVGMALLSALLLTAIAWLDTLPVPLAAISVGVFVLAWVGQFIGHRIEGKRPSFFEDMQFLMIGPMWLLAAVYRRLGIPI